MLVNNLRETYRQLGISDTVYALGEEIWSSLKDRFSAIDETAEYNGLKVLHAMQKARVSEACLLGTTGYGYNDIGREALEKVYAEYFGTEDALVRPQIASGTHALHIALSGVLRPGDVLYSPAGKPYDTLESVIGIRREKGSLAEYGVSYLQTELTKDGAFDYPEIKRVLQNDTAKKIRLVTIQRSKGYQERPSWSPETIGELITFVKNIRPDILCMVDNCYGEFVTRTEPSQHGADMVVGSLIKNPGGGLAPCGGYICGTKECVELAAYRLTSPGLGKEVGASLQVLPLFYEGFFLAPQTTANALKGAVFASALYEEIARKTGFAAEAYPTADTARNDIIQALTFHNPKAVQAFCEGIQSASPVDSFVKPEPWDMPGYDVPVIMAAGAFVSGSSIELSADGPMREPYTVFFQGGLTGAHIKIGILKTVQKMTEYHIFSL